MGVFTRGGRSMSLKFMMRRAAIGDWVPQDATFYYDKDNERVAKNGVAGSVAALVTPFQINGGYLWPVADIGITGNNAAVFMDVSFATVPDLFSFVAELANDARGERVGLYASTADVIGIDYYVGGGYIDGGSSSFPVVDGLRLSLAFTVGAGSLIWKLGDDAEVVKSGTMPTGFTKLGVGVKTDSFSPSGLTLHTLAVFNQKLDHAIVP